MNNEEKILTILETLTSDMTIMKSDMADMKADMANMKSDMVNMKSDMADMQSDMADVKTRLTKIELTQENNIIPHIQLLSEGQVTIQNQIKNLSVIDSLKDDVSTLKSAVRYLSEKVEKLEQTKLEQAI